MKKLILFLCLLLFPVLVTGCSTGKRVFTSGSNQVIDNTAEVKFIGLVLPKGEKSPLGDIFKGAYHNLSIKDFTGELKASAAVSSQPEKAAAKNDLLVIIVTLSKEVNVLSYLQGESPKKGYLFNGKTGAYYTISDKLVKMLNGQIKKPATKEVPCLVYKGVPYLPVYTEQAISMNPGLMEKTGSHGKDNYFFKKDAPLPKEFIFRLHEQKGEKKGEYSYTVARNIAYAN